MSISTRTGTNPIWTKGQTVVGQDRAGTMTSSPGINLFWYSGLQIADKASKLADEPELVVKQYL